MSSFHFAQWKASFFLDWWRRILRKCCTQAVMTFHIYIADSYACKMCDVFVDHWLYRVGYQSGSPWDQKGGTGLESFFAFPFPQKAKTFKESIINPHLTILYSSMCKILEKLVHSFNVTCLCGVKYIQYPADKTRHQTKLHRDKYGLEDESTFSLKWVTCHENKYILGLLIMFCSNRDPTMNSIQSTSVLFI